MASRGPYSEGDLWVTRGTVCLLITSLCWNFTTYSPCMHIMITPPQQTSSMTYYKRPFYEKAREAQGKAMTNKIIWLDECHYFYGKWAEQRTEGILIRCYGISQVSTHMLLPLLLRVVPYILCKREQNWEADSITTVPILFRHKVYDKHWLRVWQIFFYHMPKMPLTNWQGAYLYHIWRSIDTNVLLGPKNFRTLLPRHQDKWGLGP